MLPVMSEEACTAGSPGMPGGVSTQRDEDSALALYEVLRGKGGVHISEVYAAAGLDEGQGSRGWRRLHELGLVQVTDGIAEAVDPDAALARAMDTYQSTATEQLRNSVRLQRVTQSLLTVYRPAIQRDAVEIAVEFISDKRLKQRARVDLTVAARESCGSMHPGPMPRVEVLEASLQHDRGILARGIRSRAIYPQSCLHTPKYARYLHDLAALGVEVRLVDHAPFDMLTFDENAACIAADPARPSEAMIVVRGTALMRTYLAVYEDCWVRGVPLHAAAGQDTAQSAVTGQERVIIRLMAAGLTDDQIARKLGVHRRTVQRAIAKLMERLNASSRFEAGLKLAHDEEFAKTFATR